MEEKKRGRPRTIKSADESRRYRSSPEELDGLKEERLERMKRFLRGDSGATFGKPDSGATFGKPDSGTTFGMTEGGLGIISDAPEVDFRVGAVNVKEIEFSKKDVEAIKTATEGNFTKISAAQIEALGKVCRTDDLIDEMLAALEESGANQHWLTAAKASFQCAMMEISRAILKPKGI